MNRNEAVTVGMENGVPVRIGMNELRKVNLTIGPMGNGMSMLLSEKALAGRKAIIHDPKGAFVRSMHTPSDRPIICEDKRGVVFDMIMGNMIPTIRLSEGPRSIAWFYQRPAKDKQFVIVDEFPTCCKAEIDLLENLFGHLNKLN